MLTSAAFGGVSCIPIACLNIDKTIIIRKKDVVAIKRVGIKLKIVSRMTILIADDTSAGLTEPRLAFFKTSVEILKSAE